MRTTFIIIIMLLISSCSNNSIQTKKSENYIIEFGIKGSTSPNPRAVVFKMHLDDQLRELIITEKWDSINFSGGLFDTLVFNMKRIGVAETENLNEIIIGMATGKLYMFSQAQLDSIALKTFKKVKVSIYSKNLSWQLIPPDTLLTK